MTSRLKHRGPDDTGVWCEPAHGAALGHARLAILDLSSQGHQPMHSTGGRYVLVFNGEIYNFTALRRELTTAGQVFRGHSDTEVMLAAIERWGLAAALERFVGMFAIALWDRWERSLVLARDRLGEKPLYYGQIGNALVFGSELKVLAAFPGFRPAIDKQALTLYLRYNYIPAPYCIYQGIRKLPAGTYIVVSQSGLTGNPITYWSARMAAQRGLARPFAGNDAEAAEALDDLLRQAVEAQRVADVPLGAFLSGGVDSSVVTALMQVQSNQPVRTFTIGFHEAAYNEAGYAKAVARHLGTDHTELYVSPERAMEVIPRLATLYDEPFADSSQIPTFLVSELARTRVAVSLSGDGGDELFGGYNRYLWAMQLWHRTHRLPLGLRRAAAAFVTSLSPTAWNRLFRDIAWVLPHRLRYGDVGEKLHKLAGLFASGRPEMIYLQLLSHWDAPAALVLDGQEPVTPITDANAWLDCPDFEQRMMYLDLVTYLPDDILVKVDRAAMAVSLETRVPMLDHRVVEFAWSLPLAMKIRAGQGKWLLRQVLYRYVPQQLIERPKMGFGVPIDTWLRGPLRDWAEHLLDARRLTEEGLLDPHPIRQRWAEHLAGRRNWQYLLWDVLMFQAWRETWAHA